MKIIVGLGNPGKQYEQTRHNAGFMFLDKMASAKELLSVGRESNFTKDDKFNCLIADTLFNGEKLLFVKPQTFMNLSGEAVRSLLSYYKVTPDDLIVVSDDVDLPLGSSRIRNEGSSGGQKGLQSIIDQIGTDRFTRIRIGIKPIAGNSDMTTNLSQIETTDFVLGKFDKRELKIINEIIEETIYYILTFLGSKEQIAAHSLQIKFDSL